MLLHHISGLDTKLPKYRYYRYLDFSSLRMVILLLVVVEGYYDANPKQKLDTEIIGF